MSHHPAVSGPVAEAGAVPPERDLTRSLTLAAIGIVFGDIGTSPLYALKVCFVDQGLAASPVNVLGLMSLILWSLIVVITFKYVLLIMRADNQGEGGILALMALAQNSMKHPSRLITFIGLFGVSLFFGDGVITPAISVLSAVEGLVIAIPSAGGFVVAISIAVLLILFAVQSHGTDVIGAWFGPIMLVWFAIIAGLGIASIIDHPGVLAAADPRYAIRFFAENGFTGFLALGGVVLAVTGGEALYADMGHFGARPIRRAWLGLVLPALLLNYFGQAALVLSDPAAVANPFYLLAPRWLLLPLVVLATAATVIASQAVISGVYSATQQTIQLGFCPRMEIRYTSAHQKGQIYLPEANERLMVWVIILVLIFQSSNSLANAYGIAVTGTMMATTLLSFVVMRRVWQWPTVLCYLIAGGFLIIDLAFFGANIMKLFEGGWVPLGLALILSIAMTTWRAGSRLLAAKLRADSLPIQLFLNRLDQRPHTRVPGTAIYLTRHVDLLPHALLHNLKHNKVLHERIAFLTVKYANVPRIADQERISIEPLRADFFRIVALYGFMETPDIPKALEQCQRLGMTFLPMETSYFLGRETLIPVINPPMPRWRQRLFILLSRNAFSATDYYRIPTDRVIELGAQVPI